MTGGLSGASDEDCEQDGEDVKDESNSGLVTPLIIRPMPEPQTSMPWFFGLNLSGLTGAGEAENDSAATGGESSSHTAAMNAPPQERAQILNPQLSDLLPQSQTPPAAENLRTSFAARLIAKTSGESGAATANSTETSPASAASDAPAVEPVRFGTADSPVLEDKRHGAGGEREPNKEAGSGIKHGKPEIPVAGELPSHQSVNTILTSATPAAESVRVTEARSGQASPTQQQAPATTALSQAPSVNDVPGTNSTEPLRDLAIDVPAPTGGESNGRVQLQLTDRAGELRVRVRTSDSALSGLLQRDLGELVSRLEDSGFDAQTWAPDSIRGIAETADTRMGSQAEDSRDRDNGSGNQSQHSRDGREDGRQTEDRGQKHDRDRAPSWVEAWDGISADAARILGRR